MKSSSGYVYEFLDFLATQNIDRVLLPDTLGVLTPRQVYEYVASIREKHPEMHLDIHTHNDYDLSVANVMEALYAGANGVHLTLNGMGERAGNAPLASVIAAIHDLLPDAATTVREESIYKVSKLVETFSGFRIPVNKPVLGENVFTQTAGIHADGDHKRNLYFNDLLPERFGRKRQYALGKTSGKANIQKNLQELGLQLNDEDIAMVTQRIIELGDKKEVVTQHDLPFIVSEVLKSDLYKENIKVNSYVLTHSKGLRPSTTVSVTINDEVIEEHAQGDGQYDAFMNALRKIYSSKGMKLPKLTDYVVHIPPGSASDALCETIITWQLDDKIFKTRGLDSDQTVSAIIATQKMLNLASTSSVK
jgi:D-citramalate synthase